MRMRMLVVAGLLVIPGLVLAEGYTKEQPQTAPQGQMGETEPGQEVRTGMELPDQSKIFTSKETFEIKGTISMVDSTENALTLRRENLPVAELSVADQTKIRLNGKQATLQDLQPGTEVRAKFQLAEDKPIAVEVEAKASKEQMKKMEHQPSGSEPMQH